MEIIISIFTVVLRINYDVSEKQSAQCLANSQIMAIVLRIIIAKGQMLFFSKMLNLVLK